MVRFFDMLSDEVRSIDNLLIMKDRSFYNETTIDAPEVIVDGVRYIKSSDTRCPDFITQTYNYRGI